MGESKLIRRASSGGITRSGIYYAFGRIGSTANSLAVKYDVELNVSTVLTPLPVALDECAFVQVGEFFYIGGISNDFYKYDVELNTYSTLTSNTVGFITAGFGGMIEKDENTLLVFTSNTQVRQYNIQLDSWSDYTTFSQSNFNIFREFLE